MSLLHRKQLVRYEEEHKNVRQMYQDIQRDPYKYLLTPFEKSNAYGPIPRFILGYGLGALWGAYHLRRNNQLHLLFKFRITGDMVIGFYSRLLTGYLIGDRIGARYFCNYRLIFCHKVADYEIRKMTRQWPDAKPFIPIHEKPNSYFWV
ncbi:unnamed protein product [Moneuplotes crassus]|uniref:Uncharacterized protein n=1 Tax=Euplotes crassus TaxID=5936 RepID=A0AAD1Y6I5_EUPCR|nr:unnamed protein product [Moneuplotes crassus]